MASIDEFAKEARQFVDWASPYEDSGMSAATALRRIVALYNAALMLPSPFSDYTSKQDEELVIDSEGAKTVYRRTSGIPFQYYGKVLDPLTVPPEESGIGDIADDITDIYQDILQGLHLYDHGKPVEALWQWGFNFRIHWGAHATDAIQVLHTYLSQEDVNGLSNDA